MGRPLLQSVVVAILARDRSITVHIWYATSEGHHDRLYDLVMINYRASCLGFELHALNFILESKWMVKHWCLACVDNRQRSSILIMRLVCCHSRWYKCAWISWQIWRLIWHFNCRIIDALVGLLKLAVRFTCERSWILDPASHGVFLSDLLCVAHVVVVLVLQWRGMLVLLIFHIWSVNSATVATFEFKRG